MQISILSALLFVTAAEADPFASPLKPYSQFFDENHNLLKHTAWAGPWSQRRGVGLKRDAPAGCRVDQVAMLHRHGERYPSKGHAALQDDSYQKIAKKKGYLTGSLRFANYWKPFADGDTAMNEEETTYGPYAGLLGAYYNGADYRARYGHLYDSSEMLPIFTAGFERVTQTGRHFGQGFLGNNYTEMAAVQIIPETAEQGANTLNTGCSLAVSDLTTCNVPDEKYKKHHMWGNGWKYKEFKTAANRLNAENGLDLTEDDIPTLISIAAFELNVRGDSPWVNVFTDEEWIAFEYLQSMLYYCYFGPGATETPYRGGVYLNATRTLFNEGPQSSLPLAFSFAHDTDLTPVISLLGFASPQSFDASKVTFGSTWDITDIVPQNARIIFERMVCTEEFDSEQYYQSELANKYPGAFDSSNVTLDADDQQILSKPSSTENVYVRVVLNEAVAPIPDCMDGPGKSCSLDDFNAYIDAKLDGHNYAENCVADKSWPQYLDFFWNWNATTDHNDDPVPIPYQAGLIDSEGNPF